MENEEEFKKEENNEIQGSLFSGSLFGESKIFSGPNPPKRLGGLHVLPEMTGKDHLASPFVP